MEGAMSCETIREKLYELIFDLLDEEERRDVESHLKGCPACRGAYEQALRDAELS